MQLRFGRASDPGGVGRSQNGVVVGTLDYGDGTCDNLATLTSGGTTVTIELKGKMPKADMDGQHGNMGGKGDKDGNGGMGGKGHMGGKGK